MKSNGTFTELFRRKRSSFWSIRSMEITITSLVFQIRTRKRVPSCCVRGKNRTKVILLPNCLLKCFNLHCFHYKTRDSSWGERADQRGRWQDPPTETTPRRAEPPSGEKPRGEDEREKAENKRAEREERASLRLTRGNEEAGLLRLTEEASLCFSSFFINFFFNLP